MAVCTTFQSSASLTADMYIQMSKPPGPPYAPQVALLGGAPTVHTDVPITAVFLVLFVAGAVSNMTIFQINKRRGHKFIMSGVMFGFCMSRIATTTLRIAWATHLHNTSLAIAAQIFVAAGVVLLYVINLLFAQRIVRAAHPNLGWAKGFSIAFKVLYVLIIVFLVMVITVTVLSFYTLDQHKRTTYRRLQLSAQTYYALVSFLPMPIVIAGLIVPRKTRVEKFGSGRWRTKVSILMVSSFLLCLGAAFKVGTNFKNPRPRTNPAWYHSKSCFYIFNFTVEILVIILYLLVRVDRRFHIPDGSHGPGDYSRQLGHKAEADVSKSQEETDSGIAKTESRSGFRIADEEEVFDDQEPKDTIQTRDVESGVKGSQ